MGRSKLRAKLFTLQSGVIFNQGYDILSSSICINTDPNVSQVLPYRPAAYLFSLKHKPGLYSLSGCRHPRRCGFATRRAVRGVNDRPKAVLSGSPEGVARLRSALCRSLQRSRLVGLLSRLIVLDRGPDRGLCSSGCVELDGFIRLCRIDCCGERVDAAESRGCGGAWWMTWSIDGDGELHEEGARAGETNVCG